MSRLATFVISLGLLVGTFTYAAAPSVGQPDQPYTPSGLDPRLNHIAVIGDSANLASVGVHARAGFEMIGTHRNVGFKFGRWLDTVMMQLALGDGGTTLPKDSIS